MKSSDLHVMGSVAQGFVVGSALEAEFRKTVQCFRSLLAQTDPSTYQMCISWQRFETSRIAVVNPLAVEATLSNGTIQFGVRALADVEAGELYLSSGSDLGSYRTAGRAISMWFPGADPNNVARTWLAAWQDASQGEVVAEVRLATKEDSAGVIVAELAAQAQKAIGKRLSTGSKGAGRPPKGTGPDGPSKSAPKPPARRLKTLAQLQIVGQRTAGKGEPTGGVKNPARRGLRSPSSFGPGVSGSIEGRARAEYTTQELQDTGHRLLEAFLRITDNVQIRDLQRRRGIGADAVDELMRYFEMKAFSGPAPDVVVLTANEAKRAHIVGDDFFLVVIEGLEEGYETVLRLIPRPLDTLAWQSDASVRLAGVKRRTALEVTISDVADTHRRADGQPAPD